MSMSRVSNLARVLLASATMLATAFAPASACTGIQLTNKDGSVVSGRTVEFGIKIDISVAFVPRGHAFTGATPAGDGMKYTAKHAVVGMIAYTDVKIMDGINDAGLVAGAFYFPTEAGYAAVTADNQSRGVSPAEFPNWLLSQFASVEEARKAIESGAVEITPTVLAGWGATPPPFHYVVYDKTGASIVIEPVDGKLVIHDNPLGVMTNSPSFDWHITNLRNYITLNPNNVPKGNIGKLELQAFGMGNGMTGLPGDFSPPSRFVRAALFSGNALPSDNAAQGIQHVFHILNNFDLPKGSARTNEDGTVSADYTQMTTARDPENLRFYYKSYDDQTIRMIDMKQLDLDAKDIKLFDTVTDQPVVDMSAKLK